MTVADRIKNRREEMGLSQDELASRLGLKDKSSISKIEASGDKVSLKNIEKLAPVLNCSIQYLMGWEENNNIYSLKSRKEADDLVKIAKDYLKAVEGDKNAEEMLKLYQAASPEMRNAALAVLKSGQQKA